MTVRSGRVQHGAGVVPEHLLGDGDVAHEVGDAVGLVVGELHDPMDVVAPVDEKPVRGDLGVQIDDLRPARPTVLEPDDLIDGIRRHRLLVEPLELAHAGHLDV